MACDLPTILTDACTNGIAPVNDELTLLRYIAQLKAEKLAVDVPGTDVTLAAILDRSCTSGIGKVKSGMTLLRVIAQNAFDASSACPQSIILFSDTFDTPTTIFTTNSIAPAANSLILAIIVSDTLSSPSGLVGNGCTWEAVRLRAFPHSPFDDCRMSVWRTMSAAPSAGPLEITFGSEQQSGIVYVMQIDNVDTSGTNGSGAIVQSSGNANNTANPTTTFSAVPTVGNYVLLVGANNRIPYDGTLPSGYTTDGHDGVSGGSNDLSLIFGHTLDTASATQTITAASLPAFSGWGQIAIEILAE